MLKYLHDDSHANVKKVSGACYEFSYPCLSHWSCSPYNITLQPGLYFLEVWGAQGANSSSRLPKQIGGFGGYSSGVITCGTVTDLFLHVGGTTDATISFKGSYNGGGSGVHIDDGPGGGATDFRKHYGKWDEYLDTRIIVAGGGGGAFNPNSELLKSYGGNGGGINGGFVINKEKPCVGTQTNCSGSTSIHGFSGVFGKGASGHCGGGGGGYWGGGNNAGGGGGGSGYIGGVGQFNQFLNVSSFSSNYGPGKARITIISKLFCTVERRNWSSNNRFISQIVVIILSHELS